MEHESDGDTTYNWCAQDRYKSIGTGTEAQGDETRGDHPNYSIVEVGKNTKKNPGDLRRLALIYTIVDNQESNLEEKILKSVNYIDNTTRRQDLITVPRVR